MPTKPTIKKINPKVNSADILNAIRNSASTNYKDYVPEAVYGDAENLKALGNVIVDGPFPIRNEFLSALYNRIGKVIVTSKIWTNPLEPFRAGTLDFGTTIEEVFANIADVQDFSSAEPDANPFKRAQPDVRSAFHVINYEKQYQTTIDQKYLRRAFMSWDGVNDLIAKMTESMYTGKSYDDYLATKLVIGKRALNGTMEAVTVEAGNTKDVLDNNLAIMRYESNELTFLSPKHNLSGVMTHTPRDDQYILINTKYSAYTDVLSLAAAFHIDKADLLGHVIMINGFDDLDGTDPDARINKLFKNQTGTGYVTGYTPLTKAEVDALNAIPAFLIDKDFFQIYNQYQEFTEQYNPKALYWNYFLTTADVYSSSPFANGIVFVPETPTVTEVTITPTTATVQPGQYVAFTTTVTTTGMAPQAVNYTLSGDGADKASISREGVLTVDDDATGNITVTATSVFDPTKTAEATVTIQV